MTDYEELVERLNSWASDAEGFAIKTIDGFPRSLAEKAAAAITALIAERDEARDSLSEQAGHIEELDRENDTLRARVKELEEALKRWRDGATTQADHCLTDEDAGEPVSALKLMAGPLP